jgi:hypothetical protein
MKTLTAFRFPLLAMFAAWVWTLPLHAADPMEAHWSDVCKLSSGNQLVLTTVDGDTVEGYCMHIDANEIGVRTLDHRITNVARTALASLRVRHARNHPLASLGTGIRKSLREEFRWLLSPMAPLGLIALPGTLAWGATAAPFCVLGELVDKRTPPDRDIKLLVDPAPPISGNGPPTKSNP